MLRLQKISLLVLLLVYTVCAKGQTNYCRYFKFKIDTGTRDGSIKHFASIAVLKPKGDKTGRFIAKHHNRFEYVLMNSTDSFTYYSHFYPDTAKAQQLYCNYITNNTKVHNYLDVLNNAQKSGKQSFTQDEMMLVASRYFMCDHVAEDTSVGYHICIGINGQKELTSDKDMMTMKAFCFEAIFSKVASKKDPVFIKHFNEEIATSSAKHKRTFVNEAQYLEQVKLDGYYRMQHDEALRSALLKYYRRNKDNIGIEIR